MPRPRPPATRRAFLAATVAVLTAGCGFQLRGSASLPYQSLYVDIPDSNPLGADLKRTLRAGTSTRIVAQREEAEALLTSVAENRGKTILSLSSTGRVREFRLRYTLGFRITDLQGRDIIAPLTLSIERDFAFNDNLVLSKESEEAIIYRDMQVDMVNQVLRRLEAAPLLKRERQG
jgi:LPS-assembly lipoprotein